MVQIWSDIKANFPSGADGEIFFYAMMVSFSLAISALVSWLFRRDPRTAEVRERVLSQPMNAVQQAFVVAGPQRAVEMALFLLVRDGWVQSDGTGSFRARFQDASQAPAEMTPLEREVLETLSMHGPTSLGGIFTFELKALGEIENHLIRHGLVLSQSDFKLGAFVTAAPLMCVVAIGLFRMLMTYIKIQRSSPLITGLGIGVVFSVVFLFRANRQFGRRTALGDQCDFRLRRDAAARPRPGKGDAAARGANNDYDLLWNIRDDILVSGLRSLAGTIFAPLSTFSSPSVIASPDQRTQAKTAPSDAGAAIYSVTDPTTNLNREETVTDGRPGEENSLVELGKKTGTDDGH